jgi:hypothetical protein
MPLAGSDGDIYHRLPVKVKMAKLSSDNDQSWQTEVTGRGALDPAGKYMVEFLARGPNTNKSNIFGSHEEYWARLNYDNISIEVGDLPFHLSRLTLPYSYGRGVGITFDDIGFDLGKYSFNGIRSGAFVSNSRWSTPYTNSGLFVENSIREDLDLRYNLLFRKWNDDSGFYDFLQSFEGSYSPTLYEKVKAELAFGNSKHDGSLSGQAFLLNADSRRGKQSIHFEWISADDGYFGFFNDHTRLESSYRYQFNKRLRTHLSMHRSNGWEYGTGIDRLESKHNFTSLGGTYFFPKSKTKMYFEGRTSSTTIADAELPIERSESYFRLGTGFDRRRYNLTTYLETGVHSGGDIGDQRRLLRLSAFGYARLKKDYTLFMQLQLNEDEYPRASKSFSSSLTWQTSDDYKLTTRTSIIDKGSNESSTYYFDFEGSAKLPRGFDLDLRLRREKNSYTDNNNSLMLAISGDIGMPLGKRNDVGAVSGRIIDGDNKGIKGVVIRIDSQVATSNADGWYRFPACPAGFYSLNIDNRGPAAWLIPDGPGPISAAIMTGQELQKNIVMVEPATVNGVIKFGENGNNGHKNGDKNKYLNGNKNGSHNEPISLAGIAVELVNGKSVKKQFTASDGSFSFTGLWSGEWTVRVNKGQLPARHYLEEGMSTFMLLAGTQRDLKFRVIPKEIRIKMIESKLLHNFN